MCEWWILPRIQWNLKRAITSISKYDRLFLVLILRFYFTRKSKKLCTHNDSCMTRSNTSQIRNVCFCINLQQKHKTYNYIVAKHQTDIFVQLRKCTSAHFKKWAMNVWVNLHIKDFHTSKICARIPSVVEPSFLVQLFASL